LRQEGPNGPRARPRDAPNVSDCRAVPVPLARLLDPASPSRGGGPQMPAGSRDSRRASSLGQVAVERRGDPQLKATAQTRQVSLPRDEWEQAPYPPRRPVPRAARHAERGRAARGTPQAAVCLELRDFENHGRRVPRLGCRRVANARRWRRPGGHRRHARRQTGQGWPRSSAQSRQAFGGRMRVEPPSGMALRPQRAT
jgi:hypothetical protein